MKAMRVLWGTKREYSDIEVVEGLQRRDASVEEWFYDSSKKYFNKCFNEIFFDKDRKQEVFQTAFIKLWTEIENKRIKVIDGCLCRQQRSGAYEPMNCNLTTFLMAFARTEHRELVRNVHDCYFEEVYDSAMHDSLFAVDGEYDNADELKNRIVDECIMNMSPSCVEILTMFYYKGMSLDEILVARNENTSKDGLKAAKNKCMTTLKKRVLEEYNSCNVG
ncbi:MAG: sigma-70 family RNA polymerase sigma factor [Bacteroidaceae bacterium]|nr:sigma-70 family RNA polymerase sigma factor [Bacteroidaceae bacterium]